MARARQSINKRLAFGYMQTTGLALVLVLAAFLVSEVSQSREVLGDELTALADVVGMTAGPALNFDFPGDAEQLLDSLRAQQRIRAAVLYRPDGEVFARYLRDDIVDFEPPAHRSEALESELFGDRIDLFRPIESGGVALGTLFLRADTPEVLSIVARFLGISLIVMAIAAGIAWIGAIRMREEIATPLAALADRAERMAEGDLSTRVDIANRDEIGAVADSFNVMVKSLYGLVSQVGENTRAVSEATVVLRSASVGMHGVSSKQEAAVEDSAESIEKMSASIDEVNSAVETLAATARETSNAAVEMDGSIVAIVAHMDELSQTIDSVSSSVVQMTSAIGEIAQHSETLKTATESTASSLNQLSTSVAEVEQNAQKSQDLSTQATQQAKDGQVSVQETVDGMKQIQVSFNGLEQIISRLDAQSQSIGEVLNVIESVVEQTNLLALNAAIISSHAGEHGRAFAVVAEEVKSLSDRTAGSTREIGDLINGVQEEIANAVSAVEDGGERVEQGVALSLKAGNLLRQMAESATESSRNADEIVRATGEQISGLQRVDMAMVQVKEIAQQLNRGTHEQDNASTEITRSVERMRQLGLNVKTSTEDQRKESSHIAQSVEVVAERIDQILAATTQQSKEGEQIMNSLKVFMEVTVEASRRAEEMKTTVDLLSERTTILHEEVGRFSL